MAERPRIFRLLMPTTSLAEAAPPDPQGGRKRDRITRVVTSDGSAITDMFDRKGKRYKSEVKKPSNYAASTKAPPRPPIARPDPDKLESKQREEMERRQFAPLPADWFARVFDQLYRVDEKIWGRWAVDLDKMKLLRSDFRFLLKILDTDPVQKDNHMELAHVPMTIVDLYIYLACEYRNRAIARTLKGGDLAGDNPTKKKVSCILIDSQILFWNPDKGRFVRREDDEGNFTNIFVQQNLPLAWRKTEEALARYDDETLHNLDYLLIPYEYRSTHTVLLGIAPKQKFCFHIDNAGVLSPRYMNEDWKKEAAYHHTFHMNLLEAIVYSRFHKGIFDTVELPLYGEWSYRTNHRYADNRTTDNSPNASRQEDSHNCGMICMTNATNLIFGYDMMCCSCRNDISDLPPRIGKRPRVAAEFLNGGFNKPFDYPLFKIPTKLQELAIDPSYKHNLRTPLPSFPDRRNEREEEDEIETEGLWSEDDDDEDDSDNKNDDDEGDNEGDDEGDDEGDGQGEGEGQSSQAGARTKVKKSNKDKKVKWSGQNAIDPDPLDPDPPEPGSTADERSQRVLWPAQMDPTRTGKCGFIYAVENPRFSDPRYNSRTECKRAAIANQMENWRMWDSMPLYMFKAWMENVMAGRENDELNPWVNVLKLDGKAAPTPQDQATIEKTE